MNTTTTPKVTKTSLIAELVAAGTDMTQRGLKSLTVAELTDMVEAMRVSTSHSHRAVTKALAPIDPKAVYTVAEVAELVGLTKYAVRRWVNVGYLTNVEPTQPDREGQFHIDGAELIDFLDKRAAKYVA